VVAAPRAHQHPVREVPLEAALVVLGAEGALVAVAVAGNAVDEERARDRPEAARGPEAAATGLIPAQLPPEPHPRRALGGPGAYVDHAAHSVVAVERAHRAAHDLDALDLIERNQRPVRRVTVGFVGPASVDLDQDVAAVAAAVVEAAGIDAVAGQVRGAVGDEQPRLAPQQVGQVADTALLDLLAVDHGDVAGGVEDRALGAGRGDHDWPHRDGVGSVILGGIRPGVLHRDERCVVRCLVGERPERGEEEQEDQDTNERREADRRFHAADIGGKHRLASVAPAETGGEDPRGFRSNRPEASHRSFSAKSRSRSRR